jgi:hypothetical protein
VLLIFIVSDSYSIDREEANTGKVKQSTRGIDAMLIQG